MAPALSAQNTNIQRMSEITSRIGDAVLADCTRHFEQPGAEPCFGSSMIVYARPRGPTDVVHNMQARQNNEVIEKADYKKLGIQPDSYLEVGKYIETTGQKEANCGLKTAYAAHRAVEMIKQFPLDDLEVHPHVVVAQELGHAVLVIGPSNLPWSKLEDMESIPVGASVVDPLLRFRSSDRDYKRRVVDETKELKQQRLSLRNSGSSAFGPYFKPEDLEMYAGRSQILSKRMA